MVVVHQGNSEKGHYITFLKPAEDPHWALFDDHKVQWVQEPGVLAQEGTILVYTHPNYIVENETIIIPDDEQEEGSSPLEMGETRNNHSGQATVTTGETRHTGDSGQHLKTSSSGQPPRDGGPIPVSGTARTFPPGSRHTGARP